MSRILPIDPASASGKTAEMFAAVESGLGLVPNMTRAMAVSPSVLEGYLGLSGALGRGALPFALREKIALAVAQANGCDYCLAAHTTLGGMAKVPAAEILQSRRGASPAPKTEAALRFALAVLRTTGRVDDAVLADIRAAGFSDGEVGEIVANVALNVFTNAFNSVAQTDVDFPAAPRLEATVG